MFEAEARVMLAEERDAAAAKSALEVCVCVHSLRVAHAVQNTQIRRLAPGFLRAVCRGYRDAAGLSPFVLLWNE